MALPAIGPVPAPGTAARGAEGALERGAVIAPVSVLAAGGAAGRGAVTGPPPPGATARGAVGGDGGRGADDTAGGAAGAGGSVTGAVDALGAGGGSGAEGSWIGAVARRAVGGMIDPVVIDGALPAEGETGAVASLGWVTPAPGRARRVMRTVSFFNGTEDVFGVDVFSGSLMV